VQNVRGTRRDAKNVQQNIFFTLFKAARRVHNVKSRSNSTPANGQRATGNGQRFLQKYF